MRKVSCSLWRASLPILLLALCFLGPSMLVGHVQAAETAAGTMVYGRVVDYATGRPIPNATVILVPIQYRPTYECRGLTNASGNYEIMVTAEKLYDYWACAFFDNSSTPGFDYVPALQQISLAGAPGFPLNVSFSLLPGASIYMAGDYGPPPPTPAESLWISFTVIDQYGLLNKTNAIREYFLLPYSYWTTESDILRRMGLDARTFVVPACTPVRIEAEVENFTIPVEGGYLNLTQGSLTIFNLHVIWMINHRDYVPKNLEQVQAMMEEAERAGFYVSYERNRLLRAGNLVEAASSALSGGDYDTAYADFYEANLIITDVEGVLQSMYLNSSQSVFFITPFLGFTAVASASVIFENWRRRLAASLILYAALFGLLYLLYPGYTVLQKVYNPWSETPLEGFLLPLLVVLSLLVALFVILILPIKFRERTSLERLRFMSALAATFSVAARSLKRRRLRTLLTATFMLISVFAFITLTSLSFQEGFTIQLKPGQAPSEGFLIQKPLVGQSMPFEPIESEILHWLQQRSEAVIVAPKLENTPLVVSESSPPPLGVLYAPESNMNFSFSGVLGVYPSLEAQVTKMDSIIVQGRFLNDEDLNGILISQEAAQKLQVGLKDTVVLYGQTFNVTGIFDSKVLGGLKDLDGTPLIPQYVFMEVLMGTPVIIYTPYYVPSEGVIIIHGEKAKNLPNMVISRVDVQTQNSNDIMALARLAVLIWPGVEAFASMAGKIQHLFIGPYIVATGFAEAIVPLALVVLNVGLMMLSAVYERRREIFTMSSVGLNPSHITAVFVAEALVIGIIAGSLGYVLGLASYHFMVMFPTTIGVKQKVEAIWGILALCFSIGAAVLGTAIPALKASLTATPSLIRRWRIGMEEKPKTPEKPKKIRFRLLSWLAPKYESSSWLLNMPIQIQKGEIEGFFSFIEGRLREYSAYPYSWISNLKVAGREAATRLSFTYVQSEEKIATENELFPVESPPDRYTIKMASRTRSGTVTIKDEADIRQTADFIRGLILQYSTISKPKNSAREYF